MRSTDPIHWTTLKHIARSPAHYKEARDGAKKDTAPMALGRLTHTLVLGGPPSAVWDGTRRGKEWEAFKAANEGREIVTATEVEKARRIADAVGLSPVARPWLVGKTEHACEWDYLGRRMATRGIDIVGDGDWIADLKTSSSTEPQQFARQCLRLGYHAQLAAYLDAAEQNGHARSRAFIIGVETSAPYAVTVLHVTPRTLEEGRKLNRLWMERLLGCEAADEWPGYVQDVVDLDVGEDFRLIIDGDDEEIAA